MEESKKHEQNQKDLDWREFRSIGWSYSEACVAEMVSESWYHETSQV